MDVDLLSKKYRTKPDTCKKCHDRELNTSCEVFNPMTPALKPTKDPTKCIFYIKRPRKAEVHLEEIPAPRLALVKKLKKAEESKKVKNKPKKRAKRKPRKKTTKKQKEIEDIKKDLVIEQEQPMADFEDVIEPESLVAPDDEEPDMV